MFPGCRIHLLRSPITVLRDHIMETGPRFRESWPRFNETDARFPESDARFNPAMASRVLAPQVNSRRRSLYSRSRGVRTVPAGVPGTGEGELEISTGKKTEPPRAANSFNVAVRRKPAISAPLVSQTFFSTLRLSFVKMTMVRSQRHSAGSLIRLRFLL